MQVVHVLRDDLPLRGSPRPGGEDVVRGIRPARGQHLAPPSVPLPDEYRIARERLWRRQLLGAMVLPQPVLAAERRYAARRRDAGAGQYGHPASIAESCRQRVNGTLHPTVEYDRGDGPSSNAPAARADQWSRLT